MATKAELIKKGKELGLNLKSTMSTYELQHRIKEKEEELKANGGSAKPAPKKSSTRGRGGEY
jgi:7-cyano-7-deazaguanine synthase in queuosine biosynthesis